MGIKRQLSIGIDVPSGKRLKRMQRVKKFVRRSRTMGNKYRQATAGVPELKYCDNTVNSAATSSGSSQLLTTIAQGSDNVDRIGRKITMASVQYDVAFGATTTELGNTAAYPDTYDVCKMAIVYDKQPNGALATWSDVYAAPVSVAAPFSYKNYNNIDRFDILATEEFSISLAGPNMERKQRYVPLKLETRFDGTGNTVADIQSGALIVVWADMNSAGANYGALTGRFRILYSDD